MKKNNVNLVVTERPYSEDLETEFKENLFELFLGIDTVAEETWEPVVKVGSSDIYLAVSKKSPEILEELNEALDEINSRGGLDGILKRNLLKLGVPIK